MSKENQVEFVGENFAVLHGSGTVVSLAPDAATKPTTPISTPFVQGTNMQYWGTNNLKPTEQRQKLEKTTTAYPLLIKMATTLFGRGPQYYREIRTEEGIKRDYSAIPEIEEFLENNETDTYRIIKGFEIFPKKKTVYSF
jgi:hypothetical protein